MYKSTFLRVGYSLRGQNVTQKVTFLSKTLAQWGNPHEKTIFLSKTLALCDPGGRRDDNDADADAEIPADMGRGRQRAQEKITRKGEPLTLT